MWLFKPTGEVQNHWKRKLFPNLDSSMVSSSLPFRVWLSLRIESTILAPCSFPGHRMSRGIKDLSSWHVDQMVRIQFRRLLKLTWFDFGCALELRICLSFSNLEVGLEIHSNLKINRNVFRIRIGLWILVAHAFFSVSPQWTLKKNNWIELLARVFFEWEKGSRTCVSFFSAFPQTEPAT